MATRKLELICGEEGISAENFLRKNGISRRTVIALKRIPHGLTRNGEHCRSVDILRRGDSLVLNLPEKESSHIVMPSSGMDIPVVYEDEDIICYNKPFGVPVHQSPGHYGDTLANVFAARYPESPFRAVNRLDKDTSGLCLAAKNSLAANLPSGNIRKVYYAVCCGEISAPMRIDAPIGREDGSAIRRTVRTDGKPSVTNVFPLRSNGKYTLLKIILETGRTHQIRVHMSCAGFPLAGDMLYGGDISHIGRQALHCGEMEIIHPVSGLKLSFSAPVPPDMGSLL